MMADVNWTMVIAGAVALGAATLAVLAYANDRKDPWGDWATIRGHARKLGGPWMRYWRRVAARSNRASPVRSGLEKGPLM